MAKFTLLLIPLSDVLESREGPDWATYEEPERRDKLMQRRVLEVDHVGYLNDGVLLAGIGPGSFPRFATGLSNLAEKRAATDFYDVKFVPIGNSIRPDRQGYIVTSKFKKILSINTSNVLSINGKPIMGRLDNLDRGVGHLGLEEGWSVDRISDLLED